MSETKKTRPIYTKPEVIKFAFPNRLNESAPAVELTFNPVKLERGTNIVPKLQSLESDEEKRKIETVAVYSAVVNCFGSTLQSYVLDKLNDDCRAAWIEADENFPVYDDKVRSFTSSIKTLFAAEKKERVKTSGDLLIEGGKIKKNIADLNAKKLAEKDTTKQAEIEKSLAAEMDKLVVVKQDYAAAKAREEAMLENLDL